MFEILPVNDDNNVLAFKATGKLTDADYQQFLPILEEMIRKNGRISLYIEMRDFDGWEVMAAWDDFQFGLQHENDFKRIAIIADKVLLHAAIGFVNLFSSIEMRFFDLTETEIAWDWLNEKPRTSESLKPIQPYQNILLPTDFSIYSDVAAKRALQTAEQYGANLYVLHAVEDLTYYNESYDPVLADISLADTILMDSAIEQMKIFCDRNKLGGEVDVEIKWGNPKRSIISWARKKKADLIIMGSHGHHGVERLLGSVSTSVLHKASCDVLIVKC